MAGIPEYSTNNAKQAAATMAESSNKATAADGSSLDQVSRTANTADLTSMLDRLDAQIKSERLDNNGPSETPRTNNYQLQQPREGPTESSLLEDLKETNWPRESELKKIIGHGCLGVIPLPTTGDSYE